MQEYKELYKKGLHDPDNHDGVITHLEPDILEREVKRALGGITRNKASGGDGIPAELFQILKDGAVKVCTHLTANLENSAGATGLENSVFIPVPRKGKECQRMPKNAQTTTQLHSSQMLANNAQNSPSRLEQYVNRDFPDLQVGFRKGRGPEIKLPTSAGSSKKQERSRKKIYFCFIDYAKAFNCVGHNKLENSERDGNTRPPVLSHEKSV